MRLASLLLSLLLLTQGVGVAHNSDNLRELEEKDGKYDCYMIEKNGYYSYAGKVSTQERWAYGGSREFGSPFKGSKVFYGNVGDKFKDAKEGDIICFESCGYSKSSNRRVNGKLRGCPEEDEIK